MSIEESIKVVREYHKCRYCDMNIPVDFQHSISTILTEVERLQGENKYLSKTVDILEKTAKHFENEAKQALEE